MLRALPCFLNHALRLRAATSRRALIYSTHGGLSVNLRRSSGEATTTQSAQRNAVNVAEFTLNEDVVKQDLETMARWNELSAAIEAARSTQNYAGVLAETSRGLELLKEVGPMNSPVQCASRLRMEAAQAHYNSGQLEDALANAVHAREALNDCPAELRDRAAVAEVDQFIGFVQLRQGKAKEAGATFRDILAWIDVDAKGAMPMQAVAAVNQRRAVLSGLGESLVCRANEAVAADGSGNTKARELYAEALDVLIDALNKHIDESDSEMVKRALEYLQACFEGLGDVNQAVTTCRKFCAWCERHGDEEGVRKGREKMAALCERYKVENPLDT